MPRLPLRFADPVSVEGWRAIDDGVMGDVSHSRLRHDAAGFAVFEGVVSLEHFGGFASIRSPAADFGAPGAPGWQLDVRGDGRRYKLALRLDDGFDGVSYQARFAPPAAQGSVVRLPLAAFAATFRGRPVADAEPLDPARVRQRGLLIADRQAGPFALQLRTLAAVGAME